MCKGGSSIRKPRATQPKAEEQLHWVLQDQSRTAAPLPTCTMGRPVSVLSPVLGQLQLVQTPALVGKLSCPAPFSGRLPLCSGRAEPNSELTCCQLSFPFLIVVEKIPGVILMGPFWMICSCVNTNHCGQGEAMRPLARGPTKTYVLEAMQSVPGRSSSSPTTV